MYCQESQQRSRAKKSVSRSSRRSSSKKKLSSDNASDQSPSPPSMTENAMNTFKELRDNNQLTDVTIIASDGVRHPAHRALLAACSPYFKAIFINPFREKEESELRFDKMPSAALKELLDFAYIREAKINSENVEELLEWADYFNIEKLVRLCCDYMIERISVEKCLSMMSTAKHYHYEDLNQLAFAFIRLHFDQIVEKSPEFREIDENEVCELLSNDHLNVSNEAAVWKAIETWVTHDKEKRIRHLPRLIKTVRLALCTPSVLESISKNSLISENEECRQWVGSSFKLAYGFDEHVTDEEMYELTNHKIWSPRIPAQVILAVGGWSGGSATTAMETYDERADEWFALPFDDPSGARAYHGCSILNDSLYVLGGFNGQTYYNSVRSFDLKTKMWRDRASMNNRRCYVSAVNWNGQIWAIGGYDGVRRLQTAERYCSVENQWTMINQMSVRRSDSHAVILNDHIYLIGGFDGTECLDSVEYYNGNINRWVGGPVMHHRRSGVGATVCHNIIYAVGGFNGHLRQKSVERYDPREAHWQNVKDMSAARSNCGIEMMNDKIYVMGGFNGHTTVSSVEIYDTRADRWEAGTSLNVHRSALYCCALNNLENMDDFVRMPRHFPAQKLKAIHQRLEMLENLQNASLMDRDE